MWSGVRCRRDSGLAAIVLVLLALPGCSSIGDLGRLQQPYVSDNIHAWVGQEAATRAGAPISVDNLTDDERALRDLAFPLIEPPYDRIRWDALIYEYGIAHKFQRDLWRPDPTAYYKHLLAANYRSTAGRYNKLIDDIRNDSVRVPPFFDLAHRVIELDRKRTASMQYLSDLTPADRAGALARVGENTFTIAWVQESLAQRCAGYRFALDHLAISEPENAAAEADIALAQLQQAVAGNKLVALPHLAAAVPAPAEIVK
ncbi:MAG: hypothetical protein KGK33_04370 [Hyphomicrobiales bacterium]|jgi:hypothetical protein|nr:hypothetical protein [Hyphomicrobiales bacterium]MDE1972521.1 hypothetical protein [Hyphomicrobiales bacterium]MDE2283832.1 hypothetical protein [Hyphomicrobiales bacterium]